MIILHDYSVLHHNGFYFAVTQNKPICPDCSLVMSIRDSRRRSVKDSAGNTYIFKLRRLYCSSCHQLHLEIPDCIQPNKHYFARTIAGVQSGEIDCCAADEKTLRRWRKGE